MNKMLDENIKGFLRYQKALAYAEENLLEKALESIEEAINLESMPLFILTKGKILAQQGKFEQALETLKALPGSCEEKNEAELIERRIKKLQKPFGKFFYAIKNSRALINVSVVLFLGVSAVFITLYLNERQKAILNSNLNNIYKETEKISEHVSALNSLLENQELVEKEDLEKHGALMLDSLTIVIRKMEKQLNSKNNSINKELNQAKAALDSLNGKVEKMMKVESE